MTDTPDICERTMSEHPVYFAIPPADCPRLQADITEIIRGNVLRDCDAGCVDTTVASEQILQMLIGYVEVRVARLTSALRPFARHVGKSGELVVLSIGESVWTNSLNTKHFEEARAILETLRGSND